MPALRVACPDCGNVKVDADGVSLERSGTTGSTGTYVFACPRCGDRVLRIAGPHQIERLIRSGVTPPVPAAVSGPPPLTTDDLTALRRLLATDDWIDRLDGDPERPE